MSVSFIQASMSITNRFLQCCFYKFTIYYFFTMLWDTEKVQIINGMLLLKILPNMPLPDQNSGMMDGLRQASFEHLRLQTTLQEVLNLQTKHIIEFHLFFIQYSNTNQTT